MKVRRLNKRNTNEIQNGGEKPDDEELIVKTLTIKNMNEAFLTNFPMKNTFQDHKNTIQRSLYKFVNQILIDKALLIYMLYTLR